MPFSFYPRHEHNCANVSHCPHLGGAALGTLVMMASEQELARRALHARIDAEQARNERLTPENQRLQSELDQVKLELQLERQNKFATHQQKQDSGKAGETPVDAADPTEYLQEDILDGRYRVVLYRHQAARCDDCTMTAERLALRSGDELSGQCR